MSVATEHPKPLTGLNASGKPWGGFGRVSRVAGRDDRLRSPELQTAAIANFAAFEGLDVDEVVVELDRSGAKTNHSAELDRLIGRVESGELAGIIVPKLDRLSRLPASQRIALVERIGSERLLSATESNDVSTPEGRFVRELFFSLARMEWERYAQGFATAKRRAVERGVKISMRAPFGYTFDEAHRLVRDEPAARIVEQLFKRRAAGASWSELVAYFAAASGRKVSAPTIAHMIENRAYLGDVVYGKLENVGAHAAIVDAELYAAAQKTSADWKAGRPTRAAGATTLLAGIARCGNCGGRLCSTTSGGKYSQRMYRCTNLHCEARVSIQQPALDEYVTAQLFEWAAPVADQDVEVELGETDAIAHRRAELAQRRADAELALELYVTGEDSFGLEPALFQRGVDARKRAIAELVAQEQELGEASELEHLRTTLRAAWPILPLDEKRILLAGVVVELSVSRGVRGHANVAERVRIAFGLAQ